MSAIEKAGLSQTALFLDSPVISTGRLVLRPPHIDDVEEISELANNLEIARMLGTMPHPYTLKDARDFIARAQEAGGQACIYAITEAESGHLIGVGSLNEDFSRYDEPFLGYWIGEPYWGKGYATETARALVDLYFKVTNRPNLLASARADNEASKKIIKKVGGRFLSASKAHNKVLDETHDLEHFRISRENWMQVFSA